MLFPHRIGRVAYALRYIAVVILAVIGELGLNLAELSRDAGLKIALYLAAIGIMVFALIALFRSVLLPRVRDTGLHRASSLLVIVPFINLPLVILLIWC